MSTPRTTAGRALWQEVYNSPGDPTRLYRIAKGILGGAILAIEREAAAPLVGALRRIATLTEEDIRDYEQGLCFFCAAGWEWVPGPRGGKAKRVNTHRHEDGCSYVAARAVLAAAEGEPTELSDAEAAAEEATWD